jgi:hypothetical protein
VCCAKSTTKKTEVGKMEEKQFEEMCKKFEIEFFDEIDTDTEEMFSKNDLRELVIKVIDNAKITNNKFEITDNYNTVIQFFVDKKYSIHHFYYLKQIVSAIDKALMYM